MRIVRRAELSDCPAIVKLAMRAWPETPFPGDPPSEDFLFEAAQRFVADERNGAFVLIGDYQLAAGVFAAGKFIHPFWGEKIAAELMYYVEPAYRGHGLQLLVAVEDWARQAGAVELHCYAHTPDLKRLYTLAHFVERETTFVRSLK